MIKKIVIGHSIVAREHCEFLNELLDDNYKTYGPSTYKLQDLYIWMIRLDGKESIFGWTNTLNPEGDQVSEVYTGDPGTMKSTHSHEYFIKNYQEKRAIFDIIENNRIRKYVFRGVFQHDIEESAENKMFWKKIADFLNVPSQKKTSIDADLLGEIYIIGELELPKKDIIGVAKAEGIFKDRIRFFDYDEAKKFERDLVGKRDVCAVFFGPTPHKTIQTGNYSSLITSIEAQKEEIPAEIVRLSASGKLKITKSNFRKELKRLIENGKINNDISETADSIV